LKAESQNIAAPTQITFTAGSSEMQQQLVNHFSAYKTQPTPSDTRHARGNVRALQNSTQMAGLFSEPGASNRKSDPNAIGSPSSTPSDSAMLARMRHRRV
jgi:hypothetical protein